MKLREDAHKVLNDLDHRSPALVYKQRYLLLDIGPKLKCADPVPPIEYIWEKSDAIPGCRSGGLAEEREERF